MVLDTGPCNGFGHTVVAKRVRFSVFSKITIEGSNHISVFDLDSLVTRTLKLLKFFFS